jgi:penicillin-binding protein 2
MAIGQGDDLATPLQMVNITATIANGGTLYQPKIIGSVSGRVDPKQGILRKSRALQSFVPTVVRRNFIAPENIALIQSGLHASVQPFPKGTSYNVVDNRIDPAGKTGTAEDHPENQPNVAAADAWWVGYAPFSQPKVAVVVLVPNAGSEGAFTAAPIARKLLDDYFNLPPVKQNWLSDVTRSLASTGGH